MLKRLKALGQYGAVFVGSFVATVLAILVAICWAAYRTGVVPCALAVVFIGVFSWLLAQLGK